MKKFAIVVLFIMFAGCTSKKIEPAPVFEIPKGPGIGVINLLERKMANYSVRYGGLQSENLRNDTSNIPKFINNEIKRQAAEIGYRVEIINANEDIKRFLYCCTRINNNNIELIPSTVPVLKQLADEYDLSMIYIIKEGEGKFKIRDLKVSPKGYGLAVNLVKGEYAAFAMLKAEAIYLHPVSVTRGAECSGKMDLEPRGISDGSKYPISKVLPDPKVYESIKIMVSKFVSDLLKNSNLKG